jgi:hypothetical protein
MSIASRIATGVSLVATGAVVASAGFLLLTTAPFSLPAVAVSLLGIAAGTGLAIGGVTKASDAYQEKTEAQETASIQTSRTANRQNEPVSGKLINGHITPDFKQAVTGLVKAPAPVVANVAAPAPQKIN